MKKIDYYEKNGVCIIKPAGEMIFFFLEDVSKYVKEKISANQFRFIFDLSQVTWIDSIGLGIIAMAVKASLLNQTKICVIKPRENIARLLKMSNLLDIIKVYDTQEEAMDFLTH